MAGAGPVAKEIRVESAREKKTGMGSTGATNIAREGEETGGEGTNSGSKSRGKKGNKKNVK